MLKIEKVLEFKVEDRVYKLSFPDNVLAGEVFDVLCKMRAFVVDDINKSIAEKLHEDPPQEVNDAPKS